MAKEKEVKKFVTEYWLKDKRGKDGWITVNRFEGYIPYTEGMMIHGVKGGGAAIYHVTSTLFDIMGGRYIIYLE